MGDIKVLKIGADGFTAEHGASDDLTLHNVTASNQLAVTSGVQITNNIAFNAVTDTIAGIQNQNLMDKTTDQTITGNKTIATGHHLTIIDQPINDTDAVNKSYIDQLAIGLDWKESVKSFWDTTDGLPISPSIGDRYICSGGPLWNENSIYQWNGTIWFEIVPTLGAATFVEDQNKTYVFTVSNWVQFASIVNHNELSSKQGGTTNEYYHLTQLENAWVTAGKGVVSNGADLVGVGNNITITGKWNMYSSGHLVLPGTVSGTPTEGDVYWDGATDILYIYNGASYVNVNSGGTAQTLDDSWTAGVGGISQYNAVYISGNDTVLKARANALGTSKVIGIAIANITAGASGTIRTKGIITNAISGLGATAGDVIFLSGATAGAFTLSPPTGTGYTVVRVGIAKNATDIIVAIGEVTVRA